MTAMSQIFQDSSAGDIRLDASAGTMLNVNSPSDSQQEAQAGNMFDRRTSDQTAELAIVGATSPDSPYSGVLQPDLSSPQSNQAQPPLGLGDADIPQTIPDRPTNIAQSCSAPPHRRMLLRPRRDSCSNIPSSTNYNPALYPGGEEQYEKAKLWGVEQERKQCRFWFKTMCCNGPRAFPTDIKDCADCMFWWNEKKYIYIYLPISLSTQFVADVVLPSYADGTSMFHRRNILLSWNTGPFNFLFFPMLWTLSRRTSSPQKLSPYSNTSVCIVLERAVASMAPKGEAKGSELRIPLLSTRRLPASERSVVILLNYFGLVRTTHPFLPTNKPRTRQLWKWNPLSLTYCLHDEITLYWNFTIILL